MMTESPSLLEGFIEWNQHVIFSNASFSDLLLHNFNTLWNRITSDLNPYFPYTPYTPIGAIGGIRGIRDIGGIEGIGGIGGIGIRDDEIHEIHEIHDIRDIHEIHETRDLHRDMLWEVMRWIERNARKTEVYGV